VHAMRRQPAPDAADTLSADLVRRALA